MNSGDRLSVCFKSSLQRQLLLELAKEQEGILSRTRRHSEAPQVTTVVVDKTGTITKGKPELTSVKNHSDKKDDELSLFSLPSKQVEHPIAHAVSVRQESRSTACCGDFEILKARGLRTVSGIEYFAGNVKLLVDLVIFRH